MRYRIKELLREQQDLERYKPMLRALERQYIGKEYRGQWMGCYRVERFELKSSTVATQPEMTIYLKRVGGFNPDLDNYKDMIYEINDFAGFWNVYVHWDDKDGTTTVTRINEHKAPVVKKAKELEKILSKIYVGKMIRWGSHDVTAKIERIEVLTDVNDNLIVNIYVALDYFEPAPTNSTKQVRDQIKSCAGVHAINFRLVSI